MGLCGLLECIDAGSQERLEKDRWIVEAALWTKWITQGQLLGIIGTCMKIQVNKGMSDLGYSEVVFINDLPKDVIIITRGAYYVNSEMQKSEFGDDD